MQVILPAVSIKDILEIFFEFFYIVKILEDSLLNMFSNLLNTCERFPILYLFYFFQIEIFSCKIFLKNYCSLIYAQLCF